MLPPHLLPSPVTRLLAKIVDGLFAAACALPSLLIVILGAVNNSGATLLLSVLTTLFGLIVFGVVQIHLLRDGQTVGKRLAEIRIVRYPSLAPVTLGTSLGLRSIVAQGFLGGIPYAGALYALVDVLFVFSENHSCLHDRIASTVVVNDAAWKAHKAGAFPSLFTDEAV